MRGVTSTDRDAEGRWVSNPAFDLRGPENSAAVEAAFRSFAAAVFGWHYHFAGGSSRTSVAFTNLPAYVAHLGVMNPGDHLTLFDLNALVPFAIMRKGSPEPRYHPALTDQDWAAITERVPHDEIVVVRRLITASGETQIEVYEPTVPEDEWLDDLRRAAEAEPGEILVWEGSLLDQGLMGIVTTVSPTKGDRRVHALVDAKWSNSDGLVPWSGPY